MHKSLAISLFLISLVITAATTMNFNIFPNAMAIFEDDGYYDEESDSYNNYGNNDEQYSYYSDTENKYECQKGPFEGFFVSSPEFCSIEKPPVNISPPVQKETLTVVKNTECQADSQICTQNLTQPSNFTVVIEGNNPSQTTFPGSSSGTNIQLEPGAFNVSEQGLDPIIPQICNTMGFDAGRNASSDIGRNLFICTNFSDECQGNITIGNPQTCTIDNVLVQQNVENPFVYVVWDDDTPGNFDIFFARSLDNGQTFGTPQNISQNPGDSFGSQMAAQGNNVYVVWSDNTPGNFDIFFATSNNNGLSFGTPINISNNTGSSFNPQIATAGNNVYVTWYDDTPGNEDIFFARSLDNGQTFSSSANLSENAGDSFSPQIATQGNNVYVAWEDETPGNSDAFFARSTDNGQTFSSPDNISETSGGPFFSPPQIEASGNNVYIIWQGGSFGNTEIFFARSTDNGQTFSSPDNISETSEGSREPQIAVHGSNVYIVWIQDLPVSGNPDIFFARSTDNGQTFGTPQNISQNSGDSFETRIAASGNNVYITWLDDTSTTFGNYDTFFARSLDNGQTFNSSEQIIQDPGSSTDLHIAAQGNNVYIVWAYTTSDNEEIFLAFSINNMQALSIPENLSQNAGKSSFPKVVIP